MTQFDKKFMAWVGCAMQEGRLRDELEEALNRYNDLFIMGSKKRLKLVIENDE